MFSMGYLQNEFSAAAASFFRPPPKWKRPIIFFQFLWPHIAKRLCLNVIDKTPIHFFTKVSYKATFFNRSFPLDQFH